jgi:hypothetical protein
MHYTYIDGKRVSNHEMKHCRTFIKLQEAVGSKQAEAGINGTQEPQQQITRHLQISHQQTGSRKHNGIQIRPTKMMEDIFDQKGTSPQ